MENRSKTVLAKTYWDPRMYLEGLRQLRVIGVLYLVLLETAVLLLCYRETEYSGGVYRHVLSYGSFSMLIAAAAMAAALLMTLFLFRFQNRRESSDFYHSLPNTRTSLFTSFFTAVLTWVAAGVLMATVTSIVGLYLFSPFNSLIIFPSFATVATSFFLALASGLFIAAVTVLAMSFTGTLLSNVLVTAMFAVGPRLLVVVYFELLNGMLPILPAMGYNSVFDLHYNPLFYLFSEERYSMDTSSMMTAALYSLVIGLAYAVSAWLVFRRRRSESAGQSAINRVLQAAFRLMLAMLVCLLPCVAIVNGNTETFQVFVYYLLALTVFFLYELITTRKVRNLLKAVPSLGILLVLNVAFITSFSAVKSVILSQTPTAEEIQSVTFRMSSNARHLLDARAGDISLEDRDVCRQVSSRLSAIVKALTHGDHYVQYDTLTQTMEVDIHTDSGTITRLLTFSYPESERINAALRQTKQYQDAYMQLPPISRSFSFVIDDCNAAQSSALYDRLKEDIEAMGFDAWYTYVNNDINYYSSLLWNNAEEKLFAGQVFLSETISMYGTVTENSARNGLSLPLSTALPRTTELYLQYMAEKAPDVEELLENLKHTDSYNVEFAGLNLTPRESGDTSLNLLLGSLEDSQRMEIQRFIEEELLPQYEENRNAPADLSKPVYALRISGDVVYFNVTADTWPPIVPDETLVAVPTAS